MLYLETGSTDPYYNLAFEDYVLSNKRDENYLILWQNKNTIVIGKNQNPRAEINYEYLKGKDVKIVRRKTGGGAVYHDLGNLNYSLIVEADDSENLIFKNFMKPMLDCLKNLGLKAEISGRNDIVIEGKKVSGTAQRLLKGRLLNHGTLLFNSNLLEVADALNVDPKKYKSKGINSVKSRVGNISEFLKEEMTLKEFWLYIRNYFIENSSQIIELSNKEKEQIRELADEKYSDWNWNFGSAPKFNIHNKRYFKMGILEIYAEVEKSRIKNIKFFGDYLALVDDADLRKELEGVKFQEYEVRKIIEKYDVKSIFGSIEIDQVLDTIFNRTG
ncbi:lipoate-protein ligase A [Peptoniphilus sp. ING2-D1G]|nr:lipoate-protein ligase A [Peptoniphilus sp. ING2-D1G]